MTNEIWDALHSDTSLSQMEQGHKTVKLLRDLARVQSFATCEECERVFDLYKEDDAQEWFYGHDCEV
jgi:hypothetical protein